MFAHSEFADAEIYVEPGGKQMIDVLRTKENDIVVEAIVRPHMKAHDT